MLVRLQLCDSAKLTTLVQTEEEKDGVEIVLTRVTVDLIQLLVSFFCAGPGLVKYGLINVCLIEAFYHYESGTIGKSKGTLVLVDMRKSVVLFKSLDFLKILEVGNIRRRHH